MRVLRPTIAWPSIALCMLFVSSCSLIALDGVQIPRCRDNAQCSNLNALLPPDSGDCMGYVCDVPSGRCVVGTLDGDGDRDPPVRCAGSDCDDRDGSRSGIAPELPNGRDDNCNLAIDETGLRLGDPTQELATVPTATEVVYPHRAESTVDVFLLSSEGGARSAELATFGGSRTAVSLTCASGACDVTRAALDGPDVTIVSRIGCARAVAGTISPAGVVTSTLVAPPSCPGGVAEMDQPRVARGGTSTLRVWIEQRGSTFHLVGVLDAGATFDIGPAGSLAAAVALGVLDRGGFLVAWWSGAAPSSAPFDLAFVDSSGTARPLAIPLGAGAAPTEIRMMRGRTLSADHESWAIAWADATGVSVAVTDVGPSSGTAPFGVARLGTDPVAHGGLSLRYEPSGFVEEGYSRAGATADARSRGGWWVAFTATDAVQLRRVLELDGQPLEAMPLSLPATAASDLFTYDGAGECARIAYRRRDGAATSIDSVPLCPPPPP